jgi:DNA-binding LacI/PurR family transcriptional regulator
MGSYELKPISSKRGVPLYRAVRDELRRAIDAGRFMPGDQLPSTKALSETLDVSLVTVHRALRELVDVGVLRRGQGKGTFVHEAFANRPSTSVGLRFGLVFQRESSLADSYHSQILEGVRQGAERLGIDLVVLHFGEDWRNECQGFLYVNPLQEQFTRAPRFSGASTAGPPVMVLGASFDGNGASAVDTDNSDLAHRAVDELVSSGHTRIAYLGGDEGISNSRHRWIGFRAACRHHSIALDEDHVLRVPGYRLDESGREDLCGMLDGADRPSAIFAAGYYFALDAYGAARSVGLRIPDHLSVIGVDDPPSAPFLSPPLTTMRQPLIELGRIAVDNLLDLVGGGEGVRRRVMLTAELVSRGSVAVRGGAGRGPAAMKVSSGRGETRKEQEQ